MADAVLSDAFDALNPSAYEHASTSSVKHNESLSQHTTNWHAADVGIDANALDTQRSPLLATVTVNAVARTPPTAISDAEPLAPPKYHRRSHDDRELPPIVSIDREIPWYQQQQSGNNSNRPANNNAPSSFGGMNTSTNICNNNNPPASLSSSARAASSVAKKTIPKMSARGFRLSAPDYDEDDSDNGTPRRQSSAGTAAASGSAAAAAPAPVVVYRRHRENPLVVAAAARLKSAANNNKSETDSSDGERGPAAMHRTKMLASEKRRRGARTAERDASAVTSPAGWLV